jgi:DNA-binding NarL/FixJ family response regulator
MHRDRIHNESKRENGNRRRKIRILLVDDHPSVLAGIRSFLRSRPHLTVVGQALDGDRALTKAKQLKPDVLIVDLSLPRIGGLEVMRRAREIIPSSKIIIYSMHDSQGFIQESLSMGADAFVSKASSLRKLTRSIERVFESKARSDSGNARPSPLGSTLKAIPTGGFSRYERAVHENSLLTKREGQILRSFADGFRLGQIASKHGISFYTVVSHLRNIYDKLGVCNRSAAVAIAREKRLI